MSRRWIALAAVVAVQQASMLHAGVVEFSGTSFGTGVDMLPFTVTSPAEFLFGTYSRDGTTSPAGLTYPTGGIDSVVDLVNSANALVATNDDIASGNFDSQIRSTGYSGTFRTGGVTVTGPLATGSYVAKLSRLATANNGTWSLSLANSSGLITANYPTLNPGQTISGVTVGSGALLVPGAVTTLTTSNSVSVLSNSELDITSGAHVTSPIVVVSGGSVINHRAGRLDTSTLTIGNVAGSSATYNVTDSASVIACTGTITLGNASTATARVYQSAGLVVASSVQLGSTAASNESAVYQLTGTGALTAGGLYNDGSVANHFELFGGTLRINSPADTNLVVGTSLLWTSGTIGFVSPTTFLDLRPMFGSSAFSINAGQTLDVGQSASWTTPLVLNGGTIVASAMAANAPLTFNSGTFDTGNGGLSISSSGPLGANVNLVAGKHLHGQTGDIASGATLTIGVGATAEFADHVTSAGTITLGGSGALLIAGTSATAFDNRNGGVVTGSGTIRGNYVNESSAQTIVNASDALRVEGGVSNSASFRLFGGSFSATYIFTNSATGTITGRGVFGAMQGVDNYGVITFSAGLSDLTAPGVTNEPASKLIVTGGATLTVYGDTTNAIGSEFRVSAGSTVAFLGRVTGTSSFTGTGTKLFEGPSVGMRLASGGDTVVDDDGSLTTGSIDERSLVIRGAATLTAGSGITSRVNSLEIDAPGHLDLTDAKLVVDYTTTSPYATLAANIRDGSLFSSLATAKSTIGMAEASAINVTHFGTLDVDASSLLLRLALKGDTNLDGTVNFDDLLKMAQNYGSTGRRWDGGDFNYDGAVNFDDLLALAQNYGGTFSVVDASMFGSTFASDWTLAQSLVPEPSIFMGGVSLLLMRRRR